MCIAMTITPDEVGGRASQPGPGSPSPTAEETGLRGSDRGDGDSSARPGPDAEHRHHRILRARGPRRGRSWRAVFLAPIGDGQTRRRGSDGLRVALAALVVFLCWLFTHAQSNAEHTIATTMASPPYGLRWLIDSTWWATSLGTVVVIAAVTLASRRWTAIRAVGVAGIGSWVLCIIAGAVLGTTGGRSPSPSLGHFNLTFPAVRMAVTVAVVAVAIPYLSRWLQRTAEVALVFLALSTVTSGSGLPVAMLAGLALGWGVAALVHLIFGSPLGLPSTGEISELLADLGLKANEVAPASHQEWGVGKFDAELDDALVAVSVYGRDASDAQLLAKTARFLFYRDSGPTLTFTRRQQVEHEAYLTMMAARAGARVPDVLAAGPAGPANDALLVTRPPRGKALSGFAPYLQTDPEPGEDGATGQEQKSVGVGATRDKAASTLTGERGGPSGPAITTRALEGIFTQLVELRSAHIAHGSLSTRTILVDDDDRVAIVDFRMATTMATEEQLNRDVASALAAAALVGGPERAIAAATRVMPTASIVDALPFLQRAALEPGGGRTLKGQKAVLGTLREKGAAAADVEVPKLAEPRRLSWINLALVLGTIVGGWALIGVLINVTKSWSTITGARWGWVAIVFVLAQAAYPAIAVTTVGSVTDPLPYGRSVALEFADTFVGLAGGSMAVLASRVRFFQQEGYSPTIAVSSGVLASTASWIVKGALFLIALPFALGQLHFNEPSSASSGDANMVWLIVIAVVVIGLALGLLLMVPRWRRLAAAKLRPKASEVWSHLKTLAAHPRNLIEIFGGSIAAQIFVALALGASLHAFGDGLNLGMLIVVLTLGSMVGGLSPVPGGMGVVEAGMILVLTAAGINEQIAVAAVFVQRLFTAYLPPIWGWFVLVWMRRKEYL